LQSKTSTPLQWDILSIVALGLFCDSYLLTVVVPIMPNILKGQNFSSFFIGLFFASKPITQILSDSFMGLITNKFGMTVVFPCGLFVLALSCLVFSLVLDMHLDGWSLFGYLLIARCVQGVASSAINVAGLSIVSTCHDREIRGSAMGTVQAGEAAGVLSGPVLGGLFAGCVSETSPFYIIAGVILFDMFATRFYSWRRSTSIEFHELGTPDHAHPLVIIREPRILALLLLLFLCTCTIGYLEPLIPLRVASLFNFGYVGQGLIFACVTFGYLVATPMAGFLSDMYPRWKIAFCGVLLSGAGVTALAYIDVTWQFALVLIGTGLGLGAILCPINALMVDELDQMDIQQHAGGFALLSLAGSLGFVIGPLTLGLESSVGYKFLCILFAAIFALLAILMLLFLCRREHAKNVSHRFSGINEPDDVNRQN